MFIGYCCLNGGNDAENLMVALSDLPLPVPATNIVHAKIIAGTVFTQC
jgi:hypothetical protein